MESSFSVCDSQGASVDMDPPVECSQTRDDVFGSSCKVKLPEMRQFIKVWPLIRNKKYFDTF